MARKRGRGGGAGGGGGSGGGERGGGGNCNYEKCMGIEENTLAILENSSSATFHHLLDDRLAFLEAVRTASLVPQKGTAPTNKMCKAVFQILKDEDSLDLVVASYELLSELDKRYPRVYLSANESEISESSTPSKVLSELIFTEEAWTPFHHTEKEETSGNSGGSFDSISFHSVIEDISKGASKERCKTQDIKLVRNMLLFQYLINFLEGDLIPRTRAFGENLNWSFLRESILNVVLGSRKISYKDFVKDCLSLMCNLFHGETEIAHRTSSVELQTDLHPAVKLALPDVEKSTCIALKKLLLMIMELDSSRNVADMNGLTNRADGVRTPAAEIILTDLLYNSDLLSPFFQAFDEPDWKLKLIVQYFQKYIPKFSGRARRSNGSANDATFDGILKCFSNQNSSKGIIKKIKPDVTQLLLSHAFKAYLSLPSKHSVEDGSDGKHGTEESCLVEICENLISAFACLREEDEQSELLQFSREALFTAGTILSMEATGAQQ